MSVDINKITFLYGQTEYNILKNALHLKDYVELAKEKGYETLTITDSNLFGTYKFITLCHKHGIKPVVGLEINYQYASFNDVILGYAKNSDGYKELIQISSENKLNNKIFSLDELKEYKNLIFVSTYNTFLNKTDEDKEYISSYLKLNDFYIGIDLSFDKDSKHLYNFALKNNIKVLPLMKTLYNNLDDRVLYETLAKIGNNEILQGDFRYKNKEELLISFKDYPKVFEDVILFQNSIKEFEIKAKVSLPHFNNNLNLRSKDYLAYLCNKGLKKRLEHNSSYNIDVYNERLNYELSVINQMGYDDYFLIVWDYVLYAKKNDVLVGPGRGSACSSLVAYTLGITNVDPIKYNLLFERFLNIERVSMPDIDIDFPDDKRDFVLEYVKNKYGDKCVASIVAFSTIQKKSIIRDLGKLYNIDSLKLKVISEALNNTEIEILLKEYEGNDSIYSFLTLCNRLEGYPKTLTTHASGIIISESPLTDYVALQNGSLDLYQTQFESDDLASIGLLKMDFLVLRNLQIVDKTLKYIPTLNNININNIPLDDKKTYDMLSHADTDLIFQLEGEGIRKTIKKLKPNNINDIIALLALYRPGPMEEIDNYIARKNGEKFDYIHKDLEPILKETYGIIVYQEQIMLIANNFAGLSLGEADILRRAVSKKKSDVLIKEREKFVESSTNKGYSNEVANKIYDYIVKFAEYGFNKAHAVGYAILLYQMAYLKANFTKEFILSALNVGTTKSETKKYIEYLKRKQIKIYNPDINISTVEFCIFNDGVILPLTEITSISKNKALEIIKNRENGYVSFEDFTSKNNLNNDEISNLIFSGCFDKFNKTKKNLYENKKSYAYLDDIIEDEKEFDIAYLRQRELETLGYNLKYDLFNDISNLYIKYHCKNIKDQIKQKEINTIIRFIKTKEINTKKRETMLVGSLTDSFVELPFVIFPSTYKYINEIDTNTLYLAKGSLNKDKFNIVNFYFRDIKKV